MESFVLAPLWVKNEVEIRLNIPSADDDELVYSIRGVSFALQINYAVLPFDCQIAFPKPLLMIAIFSKASRVG